MAKQLWRAAARRVEPRLAGVCLAFLGVAQCGGGRPAPTAPTSASVSSNARPIVLSVVADRTNIEAGDDLNLAVTVEDAETPPAALRYMWSVEPTGGTFLSDGPNPRWRSPANDPVPASYTFKVIVIEGYVGADAAGHPMAAEHHVSAASRPVSVNDARREMKANSETFFGEFSNTSVPPEICTRNFAESCTGKSAALTQIAEHRSLYSDTAMSYDLQLFVRSVEWPNCTGPDRAARCALLIYRVAWVRTRRADGVQEQIRGEEYVRGVYEGNRWWLCESRFTPQ
ncbi:MAG TPA: hypothetical protein VK886_12825 [Vicinamibacterales bacterium]|nr:hypothetical protein [Vicinamibacterales bacterium]